ncbi:MBL fold metallo-hydrolase [Lederbergia sp. NSJ-179]|uniref:MBL fold metallo-hydrolase n=1 Tax=Lederbergia sp. NSJ-179 TaxID=2931402 RepID=UPI001FD61F60|nr:MBL fold metallo-hydrolase [Lederbergia sp. NSJ-179]MCJ7843406.1 MBL fold metallo-hydrolase [Lederbergia sp. NSJ-179]
MRWIQIPLGPLQTNCYLLINPNNECILFDPGDQGKELNEYIMKQELQPLAILMTHAHFDHIGAIDDVRNHWEIPVYLHQLERDWLSNPSLNGSAHYGETITAQPADHLLSAEDSLKIGSFSFELYHTPGHSPGSLSYYVKEAKAVVAGDTLFAGSIGRTDLPGGDHDQLLSSIHQSLLKLPEETEVLPGHGPITTIQKEMDENPFL